MDTLIAPGIFVASSAKQEDTIEEFMKGIWDNESYEHFLHKKGDLKTVIIRGYVPTKSELLAKKYVSPEFDLGLGHNIDMINNSYPNSLLLFDFLK